MTALSLREAAERTETSKIDVWRAIQAGKLLAQRTDQGDFAIDPVELSRVFEARQPNERSVGRDATASPEASERPETNATTDWAITLSAFRAYLKSRVEAPAGEPAKGELRQNSEERPAADLAERTDQLSKRPGARANAGDAISKDAGLEEAASPRWRRLKRLVGWIHGRHGRAARQRLRERL
jgi:hypothetical protein